MWSDVEDRCELADDLDIVRDIVGCGYDEGGEVWFEGVRLDDGLETPS